MPYGLGQKVSYQGIICLGDGLSKQEGVVTPPWSVSDVMPGSIVYPVPIPELSMENNQRQLQAINTTWR